jgi:hypothetical protein
LINRYQTVIIFPMIEPTRQIIHIDKYLKVVGMK